MLCSRFVHPPGEERHGRVYAASERFSQAWFRAYDWSLKGILRHRFATLMISLALIAATLYVFVQIPKGFLSSEDSGLIVGFTQAAQGISIDAMRAHQQAVMKIVQQDPNMQDVFSLAGAGFAGFAGNSGIFFCNLKPHPERQMSTNQIINSLRPKLFSVPGILAFMQNPPPIQIGGRLTKSPYQFTLS
jgi:HAE1 family hydrophobic/amphiphilic exporter-1